MSPPHDRRPPDDRKRPPKRGRPSVRGGKPRQAMSAQRSGGMTRTSGDPRWSAALERALRAATGDKVTADSLTHPLHSYPARMHPATAREVISLLAGPALERGEELAVLDPFCGSGTTMVETRAAGAIGIGVDANPLAVHIARAKTWTGSARDRNALLEAGRAIANHSLAETKAARRSGYEAEDTPRSPASDKVLQGWFPKHVRRELEFLYARVREAEGEHSAILGVCLSAILHKVSLRTSDSDARKTDRRIARGAATRYFRDRVELLCAGLGDLSAASKAPRPIIELGDARNLSPARPIDVVVTSPPYPGTYDYADHHALRLAFLELDDRSIADRELGARRHMKAGPQGLASWRKDTRRWLSEIQRVSRAGAMVALMVGDSVAGQKAVYADREMREAVGDGFEFLALASQTRRKLGRLEATAFGSELKCEHLILLQRR